MWWELWALFYMYIDCFVYHELYCVNQAHELIINFSLHSREWFCNFFFLLWFPVELSPLFPDTLMLGMEIRVKVSDYVRDRVIALRKQNPGKYQNIACLRTNAMKYLPNFFSKGQVWNFIYCNVLKLLND